MFCEAVASSMPLPQAQQASVPSESVAAPMALAKKLVTASKVSLRRSGTIATSTGELKRVSVRKTEENEDEGLREEVQVDGNSEEKDGKDGKGEEAMNIEAPPFVSGTVKEGAMKETPPGTVRTGGKDAVGSETDVIAEKESRVACGEGVPPHFYSEERYCEAICAFDTAEAEYDRGIGQTYKKGETHK